MIELWFYIAMMVGGPEQAFNVNVYSTMEKCTTAKKYLWKKMDLAYPITERKLYRFECKVGKVL